MPEFTKTQQRILDVLSDGRKHQVSELEEVLPDREGENQKGTVHAHLSTMRKKLQPIGQDIICQVHSRRFWYIHVRLLASNNE